MAQAGPYVDLAQIVAQLVPRVRNLHHQLRSNVYVIADRQGRIFLLSEAASTAPQILKHVDAADLVGVYTRPTRAQLFEDLAKHLCENGVVSEQLIYEAVRQVEG